MKNKKNLLLILLIVLLYPFNTFSNDIEFEADEMDVKDDGKIIYAYNSNTIIKSENITIKSNQVKYDKKNDLVIFTDDVDFKDVKKNLIIFGDKIIYKKKENIVYSLGQTKFKVKNKYNISSNDVYFDRNNNIIYSDEETIIKDNEKNIYKLKDKFNFDLNREIIKAKKSFILDKHDHKYMFEDIVVNLKNNQIAGKELRTEFEKSYFGNEENDPILRGRSAVSDDQKMNVYKAVFSTCNIEDKECRGWELSTNEFIHDKKKKLFIYKDSWFKLFDFKVFFLPYFSHPDPSVKRKSGFLTPTYASSDSLGTSLSFPYFKVLGVDRDITFSPTYYADKSFLLQNEYRQVLKDSNILSEFGFLIGNDGTKAHLFYNQVGEINSDIEYELNLQNVKGDNYLKTHDLEKTSLLIKNTDLLLSNLDIFWDFEKSNLFTSFKIYEDLSRGYNDRYSFVLPDFNFKRQIDIPENYNGVFTFSSSGHNKFHNTNVRDTALINDFNFGSNENTTLNGLISNYYLLLKNTNRNSDNPSNPNNNEDYDLYQTIKYDLRLPLIKRSNEYVKYLEPIASLRYSPNGDKDISGSGLTINYNNAFSMDRIGDNSQVEGGEALTIGMEYRIKDNNLYKDIFQVRIANILKPKKNYKMPKKSKLNETRSDIFGDIKYNFNDNFDIRYGFSYDRDLEYSNLDSLVLGLRSSKFETTFNYMTENHDFGDSESLTNLTGFKIDKENTLTFTTSKNLRDDFTEFYNLLYEYKTDCLSINLDYSRSFYNDGNLEPNETLSFLLKIIPFTELGVANLGVLKK